MIAINISGGVYTPDPVEIDPDVILENWSVFEIRKGRQTRHFCGHRVDSMRDGRVSSEIKSFDRDQMIGTTRSGRTYKLVGNHGQTGDSVYVKSAWLAMNGLKLSDTVDVTGEYFSEKTC